MFARTWQVEVPHNLEVKIPPYFYVKHGKNSIGADIFRKIGNKDLFLSLTIFHGSFSDLSPSFFSILIAQNNK